MPFLALSTLPTTIFHFNSFLTISLSPHSLGYRRTTQAALLSAYMLVFYHTPSAFSSPCSLHSAASSTSTNCSLRAQTLQNIKHTQRVPRLSQFPDSFLDFQLVLIPHCYGDTPRRAAAVACVMQFICHSASIMFSSPLPALHSCTPSLLSSSD